MQDIFRILIVVIHHVLAIPLSGGRTGTFVENRVDITHIITSNNAGNKIFFIHVISDIQINQIDEFGAVFQVIHNQNIFIADIIQRLNDVAANETGAASDDNHQVHPC
ncbi:7-keto-8-aminopelargonate synthetase and related enzymes [Yersinia enterocolitica]|nr:7-keto-8-aminopelargonate synthetase and related enzymes [Yersinia enterocolitica]